MAKYRLRKIRRRKNKRNDLSILSADQLKNESLDTLKEKGILTGKEIIFEMIENIDYYIKNKRALNQEGWNKIAKILLEARKDKYTFPTLITTVQNAIDDVKKRILLDDYTVNDGKKAYKVERLAKYIDVSHLVSLMIYEVTPKGYSPETRVELFRMMLEKGYDPAKVPAYWDKRYISFGAYQMRLSTHGSIQNAYKNVVPNYDECLSVSCQTKVAYLLLYDNLNNFQRRVFNKSDKLIKLFKDATVEDKKRFIGALSAAMFNTGVNDVVRVMRKILKEKNYGKLSDITKQFITSLKKEGGTISGPYSKELPIMYDYLSKRIKSLPSKGSNETETQVVEVKKESNHKKSQNKSNEIINIKDELLKYIPVKFRLEKEFTTADTDGLSVSIENMELSESQPKTRISRKTNEKTTETVEKTEKRKINVNITYGSRGFLHAYRRNGVYSYTFTLPVDWTTKDLDFIDLSEVEKINKKKITPGDWFWVPINSIPTSAEYINIYVSGGIDKSKLIDIASALCKGPPETSAKIIRLYSNLVDLYEYKNKKKVRLRIPCSLLKENVKNNVLTKK